MNSLAKLIASVAALIIALSFAWIALTITGIVPYHIARFTMYHGLTALVALKSRTPAALTLKMKLPLGADLRRRKALRCSRLPTATNSMQTKIPRHGPMIRGSGPSDAGLLDEGSIAVRFFENFVPLLP